MRTLTFLSSIACITICAEGGVITSLNWRGNKEGVTKTENTLQNDADSILLNRAKIQILEYFNGERKAFDLPLSSIPVGSEYQTRVWRALCNIPYGATVSYKDLADGLKSAPRAIGQACRANRIPILIPCHRVVSKNGSIGGFAGQTDSDSLEIQIKKTLIALEASKM
ncbi:MAG: methylated-DNA--[protein]-cysteine S-methyltransferase [Alphaproteobacteria bacterium]|nr:methylated-DNA--[protein]-cysteine S-methyltransferase [Alphaproteobacteria bacterium]